MIQRHITIGNEFFAKAFNDYADWKWAIMREFFQNSVDAGADNISVAICEMGGQTHLEVRNDGDSMSEEILVEKLLALGGSGKNFDGENTGGFGKAKEILYFCHESYSIHSGGLFVEGSGATYTLAEDAEFFDGACSKIVIDGHYEYELLEAAKKWIGLAQCKVSFMINGVADHASMRKGSPRRDLGFGKVYSNKSNSYQMVVRINGMPMFTEHTSFDRFVIVELQGDSSEVMTSNRDGLVRPFSSELSDFVTELAVDKRSALKGRSGPRYTEYRGTKLCHSSALDVAAVVAADSSEYPEGSVLVAARVIDETPIGGPVEGISVVDEEHLFGQAATDEFYDTSPAQTAHGAADLRMGHAEDRKQVATLGTNFILKNETDLKVPRYFDPGSGDLSAYSFKLIRYWGRIMLEMHRLFDHEGEFSIGFIFDEGDVYATEAECEQGDYGLVYYLNPCRIVEQSGSYSKSFKKRFKLTERDRLVMIGLHEFVHAVGNHWHDEDYANKLTDMGAFVMKHRKRFNWCFK